MISLRQASIDLCIQQGMYLHLARSVPFVLPEQYPPLPETLSKALEGCLSYIEQTIAYHRSKSNNKMDDVSKIILSGPEDMLPHFKKFLEDKLNLMVEIASPFKTLDNLPSQQDQQRDADFTVAVGLALQAIDLAPVKINLLSSYLKEKQAKREKIRYRWGSFIFAALLPLVYNSGFVNQLSMKEDAFKRLQLELKEYDKAIPNIRQIAILKQEDQTITTSLHELKAQVSHSHSLLKILSELSELISDEVWINYLSAGISGDLKISGHAAGYESIKVFINNLENSKMFKQVKLITANSNNDKNENIDFSIEVMEP